MIKTWESKDGRYSFSVGDRVYFDGNGTYRSTMDGKYATVVSLQLAHEGSIGIEFDDPVGYGHDCEGAGRDGGYCAWVFPEYLCADTDFDNFEITHIEELFA